MLVTKGHGFNPREEFFAMFDSFGSDIRWSSVEHPAADYLLSPKFSEPFDVYVFYDRAGEGFTRRRARVVRRLSSPRTRSSCRTIATIRSRRGS